MKTSKSRLLVLASVGFVLAVGQVASSKDITIADPEAGYNYLGSTLSGPAMEDNEVENGNVTGQQWDLEAVTFDGGLDKLRIISGYNLINGDGSYRPGDIFFNTTGLTPTQNLGATGYNIYANNGWDYVIHFDNFNGNNYSAFNTPLGIGSGAYSVYKLLGQSGVQLMDVWYDSNNSANPWRYISGGGAAIATGTAVSNTYIDDSALASAAGSLGFVTGNYIPTGGFHYSLELDTSWFFGAGISTFGGQITMGCGNDVMSAYYEGGGTKTPDGGASLMLVGMGLVGLFAVGRKLRL